MTLAPLGVAAMVLLGAALLAGALVPWESDRFAEQLGAYAALAVLLTALSFALARLAPMVGAERGTGAAMLGVASLICCLVVVATLTGRRA